MRRLFLGLVPALVLAASLGGGSAPAQLPATPNIVVIMSDDQTVESMRVMAKTQALLAARGTTFDSSFASFALCCPSRATFLTGQYAHNHGVQSNRPPTGGYYKLDSTNTLPVWLQRAGYYTAHIGKYLNGYGTQNATEIPPGWSNWQGSVDPSTYRFYGYTLNENGTLRTYEREYQADLYAERAAEIITQHAGNEQPLFLSVAFLAPHSGGPREPDDPRGQATPVPPTRYHDRFASEALPMPPSFNEADVSDKPARIRWRGPLRPAKIAAVRENYQQRLESLLAVDDAVARIVDALRTTDQLDNTLIVYTSDNGFFHGEHRVPSGKVLVYEPSIRVPLVMRGPGVAAGRRVARLVANIDLAPTIVDAANARASRRLDGRSLLVLNEVNRPPGQRAILIEGPANDAGGQLAFSAIRTPRYLYAEHATGERELYDLARDPYELQSLHADPSHAGTVAALARRLAALRGCAGQSCYVK
jgi:arylsulfatase A-like enzyme